MKKYEIIQHEAEVKIKATASTRVGLLSASLQGLLDASKPKYVENAEQVEREFSVSSDEFELLLIDFLSEAVNLSNANSEAYEDVSFDLITDKQANGKFLGRPVSGFENQIKSTSHKDLSVKKNAQDLWEAVVT
ncbi:MAG: archease, partial [Patescibacteria group bacterium]